MAKISDILVLTARRLHDRGWYGLSVRLLDFDMFLAALPRTSSRIKPIRVTGRSWPYPSEAPFPLLPLAGALALAGSVAIIALVIAGAIP